MTAWFDIGERAVEALREMDQQIIPWFQSAAGELLKEMPAEKALALALAKITGNTELKVQALHSRPMPGHCFVLNCCFLVEL